MISKLILIALAFAPGMVPLEYERNYDGDTITFRAEVEGWEFPVEVRVRNIDAPEIRGMCAAEKELAAKARDAARAMLTGAGTVGLAAVETKPDRYGRVLANVVVDGADLGERLVEMGLAREWDGARRPWC